MGSLTPVQLNRWDFKQRTNSDHCSSWLKNSRISQHTYVPPHSKNYAEIWALSCWLTCTCIMFNSKYTSSASTIDLTYRPPLSFLPGSNFTRASGSLKGRIMFYRKRVGSSTGKCSRVFQSREAQVFLHPVRSLKKERDYCKKLVSGENRSWSKCKSSSKETLHWSYFIWHGQW